MAGLETSAKVLLYKAGQPKTKINSKTNTFSVITKITLILIRIGIFKTPAERRGFLFIATIFFYPVFFLIARPGN